MNRIDIDCIELVGLSTAYFEDALSRSDVERIEHHLGLCDGCNEYVRQMRLTQETLGRVDAATLPVYGREKLLDTFRAWKRDRSKPTA